MPIKVKIEKLVAWNNDMADQIKVEKLNEVAEDFAREVMNELGDLQCPEHKEQTSTITIIADRTHQVIVRKKFCCRSFEEKVSLKVER